MSYALTACLVSSELWGDISEPDRQIALPLRRSRVSQKKLIGTKVIIIEYIKGYKYGKNK